MNKNPVPSSSTTVASSASSVVPLASRAETSAATTATTATVASTAATATETPSAQRSLLHEDKHITAPASLSQKHEESSVHTESVSSKSPHHHRKHHEKKHHGHDHDHHHHHHHHHKKHHGRHRHKHGSSSDTSDDDDDDESQATSTTLSKTTPYHRTDDIDRYKTLLDQLAYLKDQRLKAKQLERHVDPDKISVVSSSASSVAVTEDGSAKPSSLKDPVKVQLSQTGLIQSLGRPFNENPRKFLAILSPGNEYMLTRRASEIRLKQLPVISDLDIVVLEWFEKFAKIFACGILGVGIAFFITLMCTGTVGTPMEYLEFFFHVNPTCLAIFILATIQPFAVAPGCRYALINLKHVRTYFIRVPPSMVLHFAVLISSIVLMANIGSEKGDMFSFLDLRMSQYFQSGLTGEHARNVWDSIQNQYTCCGIDDYTDWIRYSQAGHLPLTCCESAQIACLPNSPSLYRTGCRGPYKGANITMSSFYFILSLATIVIQGLSVLHMVRLWKYIGDELYDDRSALYIFGGKFCSLCTIEDSDAEVDDASREKKAFRGKSRLIHKGMEHSPEIESVISETLSQDQEPPSEKSILETSSILSLNTVASEHDSQISQPQSQLTASTAKESESVLSVRPQSQLTSTTKESSSVNSFLRRENRVAPAPVPKPMPPQTNSVTSPTPVQSHHNGVPHSA